MSEFLSLCGKDKERSVGYLFLSQSMQKHPQVQISKTFECNRYIFFPKEIKEHFNHCWLLEKQKKIFSSSTSYKQSGMYSKVTPSEKKTVNLELTGVILKKKYS